MTPSAKTRLSLLLRLVLFGGATALITQDAEAQTYDLVCNGIRALIMVEGSSGPEFTGGFAAAPQNADAGPMPFGTCAWHDRVLRPAEPLCITVVNPIYPQIAVDDGDPGGALAWSSDTGPIEGALVDAYYSSGVTTAFTIGPKAPNGCFTATSSR